jgi:flagellar biosynthesis anti-sigma factor FlgM
MTVDEAKVARLQKMIDEGSYKTDAAAIADRLVDAHLALPDQD